MNIKKMLEAQEELDKAMFDYSGLKEYPIEQIKTAYRVELGEVLQEAKMFKYWKKNKGVINPTRILEELADCLHFALSLENKVENYSYLSEFTDEDFKEYERYSLYEIIDTCFTLYSTVLADTIDLGLKLGYSLDDLEKAYYDKNKINWERINNNY